MKEYRCKKTCYWGPQPGSESLYQRGDIIFATGSERQLDEFFEPVAIDQPGDTGGDGKDLPPGDTGNGDGDDPPGDDKDEKVPNRRKRGPAGAE